MADSVKVMEPILDHKMDSYGYDNTKNLMAQGELTVTITLHEYRDLVSKVATREQAIAEANTCKYERESENKRLKEEISQLKAELYEYQKRVENEQGDSV